MLAPVRPGPADVARHLGLVVHDLRGPAAALTAFARFLDEQTRGTLDDTAASWLDGCQANAELTAHLCEALSMLEGSAHRSRQPLRQIVAGVEGRLQKLLARSGIRLKVSGVFPDREFERRRLGLVLEALLVSIAHAAGAGRPGCVAIDATEDQEQVVVSLRCVDGAVPGMDELVARLRGGAVTGLSELAACAALADLGARIGMPSPDALALTLPSPDQERG